ncbi:mitogen-activated protein kinase kinase kinase 3-like [Eucalyptus grandis]|uniref:mitogen-activated protein kinase kinase kinase 3-like n=1 Tax=Eucalyptus grandis TaxID=71139 RepID=UPI00192EEB4C|nr:mitogen-activated protein kinase kinase kinase 3-like [Eucalyptus grandis]
MRKLLTYEWLLHLRNLQSIEVAECKGMVELISGVGQGQEGSITTSVNNTPSSFQPSSISLPKLECLKLRYLHQLKSIYKAPISCDYIRTFCSIMAVKLDLKGANLFVDASGIVRLADFGIAKHLIQSLMVNNYSMDLDCAADMWSLGHTITEMITVKLPRSEYEREVWDYTYYHLVCDLCHEFLFKVESLMQAQVIFKVM